ncbi:hypothetical protein [Aridibaculum aurantiacum]|uniref:DUF7948 domain-containing protein n=1 Tax=Aridibaculum aurantiacum TaxID=2810307 RepID=UPI001A9746AF|nr:hypothetical protein [Aridibaculum aurantiacum]
MNCHPKHTCAPAARLYSRKSIAANTLTYFVLFLSLLLPLAGTSQHAASFEFVENKGQWNNSVFFKADLPAGAFFLEQKGFTVLQHHPEDLQRLADVHHGTAVAPAGGTLVRSHAYNVEFLNAAEPTVAREGMLNSYNNYFIGNDPAKWAGGCKIYQHITFRNIYPCIDVKYYSANGQLKYDLLVHPGADISTIAMKIDGAGGLAINNGDLIISTSVGDVKELAPYAYQQQGGGQVQVSCNFRLEGNVLRFEAGSYDATKVLVIDPTLVFSTFTGSTADNWGYTATYGPGGTAFAAGIVLGSGYPVSPGAYQNSFTGGLPSNGIPGYDIGIIKLNATGSHREYATYLGSNGNEFPHSMVTDLQGNLVISGYTNSATFPSTAPIIGPGGNGDIFLTKFTADGTALIGSRVIGGTGPDGVNIKHRAEPPMGAVSIRRNYGDDSRSEVLVDIAGNIILASCTQSSNFPVTAGAFQPFFGGGAQDGAIIKMSPDLSTPVFISYLGGSGDDGLFTVAINPFSHNLYVGGSTTSNGGLPGTQPGIIASSYQGGLTDGFVSIINPTGTALARTTFLGTWGNDMLYGLKIDNAGFPYVTGTTTVDWPVLNAAFSQTGGKQFIAKLQPDLSAYVYSTRFGTNTAAPNLSTAGFMVDGCENVYLTGWGGSMNEAAGPYPTASTNGLTVTPNAIQSTTDGSDFYFFVLQKDAASQLYGSFFGQVGGSGEHVDGGTSRFDPMGVLYQGICANCGRGAIFPTTPGAWAPTNGSNSCNQAVVKISFDYCTTPVPVHLVSFTGKAVNRYHHLSWRVVTEEKGDMYIVETATNPQGPFRAAYAATAHSSTASNTYTATLPAGNTGDSYYRLKIVSATAATGYSKIIRLGSDKSKNLEAIVAGQSLHLRMPNEALHVSVYTVEGKLLATQPLTGAGYCTINLQPFPKGTLIVKVQMKEEVLVKQVVY